MSKHQLSLESSAQVGQVPALVEDGRSISYLEYHRMIAAVAGKLEALGIREHQRVGLISENSAEYIVTLMGSIHAGAVACPISTRFPTAMIEKTLGNIGCEKVVAPEKYRFESKHLQWLPIFDLSALKDGGENVSSIDMDQEATIVFTSGTSFDPKAVLHTFGNHYYSALGSNLNIELRPGDRWLLSLPLYHVGGLGIVFRCLLSGSTAVISGCESLGDSIDRFDITHLSLVPTQLKTLLEQKPPRKALSKLKCCLVGGGFLPPDLADEAINAGIPIYTTYGSTEMASQVTTTKPDDGSERLYTSGKVLKYRELKLSDEGEILVRGETLFNGYVMPSVVELVIDADGWFATGDLGKIDSDGYLVVTGRKDNMFISGGENIYPEEIEGAIRSVADVDDVIVVSINDDRFGQRPIAFVKHAIGKGMSSDVLLEKLAESLPKFKIPTRILPWPDDLPQTGIKPDRAYFKSLANSL